MPNKKGRPNQLKEKGWKVVQAFEEGCMSVGVAIAKAGVSPSQWKDWRRKGMAGEEPYANWWEQIRKARGEILCVAEETITQAVQSGSTADAWRVLRTHGPDVYREEKEPEEEKSAVQAYVPGSNDDQVKHLQAQIQRVLEAADELPEEWRDKIIGAIAG